MVFKWFFILIVFASSDGLTNEVDYIDDVLNLLFSGDYIDVEDDDHKTAVSDGQPFFDNGLWKCGSCDVIDPAKLIHSEVNDVETNIIDNDPPVVQVGLTLDNMQCVTVSAGAGSSVRMESGSCSGAAVTLSVFSAQHFIVNVYGN